MVNVRDDGEIADKSAIHRFTNFIRQNWNKIQLSVLFLAARRLDLLPSGLR
jgi:hypothetical protein